jgi:hypothetical protein
MMTLGGIIISDMVPIEYVLPFALYERLADCPEPEAHTSPTSTSTTASAQPSAQP